MAKLEILHYPDPRLRNQAEPVRSVDARIRKLVDDMLETMYDAPGIGLAATQVNVAKRVIVIDISEDKSAPQVFINPVLSPTGKLTEAEEGCLSVPGIYEIVNRPEVVAIKALDRDGNPFKLRAEGLLSVCVQHEVDHLEGKLFVDYLSRLKQQRIRKKAIKQRS
jgi:peptide deformylase